MGLLDRLRRLDGDQEDTPVEPPAETAEKVNAILGVLAAYLDHESSWSTMLYTIARRELAEASLEQIDVVLRGIVDAADRLRPLCPPVVPALPSGVAAGE